MRRYQLGVPCLPIYTVEEARDYAEACAERWCTALALPHPLTYAQWEAVGPPDFLAIPGEFWDVVIEIFLARCGVHPSEADLQHFGWWRRWFGRQPTWIEALEADLRAYDEILAESAEAGEEPEEEL